MGVLHSQGFYLWIKALHIISMVAWMAGMLYLPRLFVYHCEAAPGSAESERFKVMEKRLLRVITNPAMVATWIFGITLVVMTRADQQHWFQLKFLLVLAMSAVHGLYSRWRRDFAKDANRHPASFYRLWNEVPTVLLIAIVILVVVKPF